MRTFSPAAATLVLMIAGWTLAFAGSPSVVVQVVVRGNEVTADHVILREMALKPGSVFSTEELGRDRERIYNLGLFNRVDTEYALSDSGAVVVVTVDERWYIFPYPIFGIRYRDFHKLYYGAGFLHQNFRGQNEKVHLSFSFGYDQSAGLMYQNPKITDEGDFYASISLSAQRAHNLGTDEGDYLNSTVSLWGTFGERFGLTESAYILGGYEVWQVSEYAPGRTASASGRDAFPGAGVGYRQDTRNIREYATDGSFVSLNLLKLGFGESDVNLLVSSFDLRQFVPFGDGATVGFRAMAQTTWGGVIPTYRKAFFGYYERIRGYFNERIESDDQFLGSAEVRVPILSPRYYEADFISVPQFRKLRYGIYVAAFADAGRAWNRNDHVAAGPWLMGAGVGLHFILPYGLTIRPEVAVNDRGAAEVYVDFDASF